MKKIFADKVVLLIALSLFACGKKELVQEDFKGEQYFQPPMATDVIAPVWVRVSSLLVKDHSENDAHVEVSVKGRKSETGVVECVFITTHPRFRSDRNWSPLPLALFTPEYESPDGIQDLSDLFRQTLDFDDKVSDEKSISVKVAFTRGKTFRANWQIYPLLQTDANGTQSCTAIATLQTSSQVGCHGDRCRILNVTAVVSSWNHFLQRNKPPRETDDLYSLTLQLEDVDAKGEPNGTTYSFAVPEFN